MIETARKEHPSAEFALADATSFTFAEPFDAVFSNAALYWVSDPEAAVICIARALFRRLLARRLSPAADRRLSI